MLRGEHFSQHYLDMLRDPKVRPVDEHGMLLVRSHSCAGDSDFPFVFFTSFDETGGAVAFFYICSNQTTSQSVIKELKIVKVMSEGC